MAGKAEGMLVMQEMGALLERWRIFIILITARLFRGDSRYHDITYEMVMLLMLGLAGFAFVVVGEAGGFNNIQTGRLSVLIVGVALAVLGAIATSFTAFSFRWGTDVASDITARGRSGVSEASLDMFGVLVAFLVANSVSAMVNIFPGVSSGESMDTRTLLIAVLLGGATNWVANVAWWKANLSTDNLGINALAYATPIFSLMWLFLFSQVAPERPDYLVAGAVGIIIVNLLINFEAEIRFGFKALLLARRNVIDESVRDRILAIDYAVNPGQLQNAYHEVRADLTEAAAADFELEDQAQLAEAETQLNVIAHSRQQGIEFGELFALIIFGGITVFIGLASRPGVTGWIGFLVEMLVVLFSAVIVFLVVNVWDLHRDRAGEILEKNEEYQGYGVVFRDAVNRRFEQTTSIAVGLLVTAAFAALLWHKWLP